MWGYHSCAQSVVPHSSTYSRPGRGLFEYEITAHRLPPVFDTLPSQVYLRDLDVTSEPSSTLGGEGLVFLLLPSDVPVWSPSRRRANVLNEGFETVGPSSSSCPPKVHILTTPFFSTPVLPSQGPVCTRVTTRQTLGVGDGGRER